MNTKRQRTWNPARATSLTGGVNSFSIVRSDRQSKCFSKPPSAILLRSDSRSVLASHSTRVATTTMRSNLFCARPISIPPTLAATFSFPRPTTAPPVRPATSSSASDAYYRLGQAYVRTGDRDRAQQQFQVYQRLREQHLADLDKQRAEIRQFVYSAKDSPSAKP